MATQAGGGKGFRKIPNSARRCRDRAGLVAIPLRDDSMGSSSAAAAAAEEEDVSLDLKLFTARTVAGFLKEALAMESGDGRVAKLEESVRSLEEEKRKIEAFKRELPLCMHLLTDGRLVIEGLEKELEKCRGERCARVFGESILIKEKFQEEGRVKLEKDCEAKVNWMSSAQLWSDNPNRNNSKGNKNGKKVTPEGGGELKRQQKKEKLFLESKSLGGGGAFVPFKGLSAVIANGEEGKPTVALSDLSLQAPAMDNGALTLYAVTEGHCVGGSSSKGAGTAPTSALATAGDHPSSQAQQQPPRKLRRCWSPELHRRFLFALQKLGGAQAICRWDRTLGSSYYSFPHLFIISDRINRTFPLLIQKYRLHARRIPNSSDAANRRVAVARGVWVPEEQYSNSSQQSVSQSGSPQSPLQLAGTTPVVSVTAGDSCEEEDEKSESNSWK
ncbi:hypothetical protein BHE74_00030146 [Ensete ventricosum]|nr:hypothetical protein BHE74_00030146 [Ensete ventricosum]RZS05394.1 hypothetical protein BHM03_00035901 [Ensete ventricosum]